MAPPNPRVVGAFRAMKALGISEDKVKPVLKNLLRLYNKNWDLIEEENYRALADAIFDNEESKQEAVVQEESEPSLKRQRLKQQLTQPNGPHESHLQNQSSGVPDSHQSMGNGSSPSLGRNKGKQPITGSSSISPSPTKRPAANQSLIRPKDEPITDELPHVICPGSSSKGKSSVVEPNTNNGTPPCSVIVAIGKPEESLEIASSLTGEVKIMLKCGFLLERSDFHMPTLDEVVKLMEEKCLKRYKEIDPTFSVREVMKDVCQSFWEMGAESAKSSPNE